MKRLLLLALVFADSALADSFSIGSHGINSKSTGLNGSLGEFFAVGIGEADLFRSGKSDYDPPMFAASNTTPYGVYYNGAGVAPAGWERGHSTFLDRRRRFVFLAACQNNGYVRGTGSRESAIAHHFWTVAGR
jgi:hypothetical protein